MAKGKVASVAKIGIIYTISNIVVRGMVFLSTPIFTRLLTQAEYGDFSNISSWANIISIIVTMQLYVSIVRAKYDYGSEIDKYLSSILVLGNLITLIWWCIVEYNLSFFESFLDMDRTFIRIIFIYALFSPAMQILTYTNRIYSRYKLVICLTWITLLLSTGGSVILVLLMSNHLLGRILGNYITIVFVDIALWLYILLKGHCISPRYWKYALIFSIPLIPHELAGLLLASSDRIIVKRLCGSEDAALYSLAYTISTIASVLLSSLNQAWQPWMYDKLEEGKTNDIYKFSIPYTFTFAIGCIGIMLMGPEIIMILGGETYAAAKYVIPPVCFSIMLQFIYTLYANIEFYEKKTGWISLATLIASIVNIALNFILIPIFGYIAAAYTTVIGFALMVAFHYFVVKFKTEYIGIYSFKKLLAITAIDMVAMIISLILYQNNVIRYIAISIFTLAIMLVGFRNKSSFLKEFRKNKNPDS